MCPRQETHRQFSKTANEWRQASVNGAGDGRAAGERGDKQQNGIFPGWQGQKGGFSHNPVRLNFLAEKGQGIFLSSPSLGA